MPNESYATNIDGSSDGQPQLPQINANFPAMTMMPIMPASVGFFPPDYYTAEKLAEIMSCTAKTINEHVNACEIPYRKFAGRRLISWRDIVATISPTIGPEKARGGGKRRPK